MTKKILSMLLLLALAVGLYVTATAKSDSGAVDPTQTAQPTPTTQASQTAKHGTCEVYTGVDGGTVNLRSCAGTSCGVLDILTEGESLDILTAGLWVNVTTKSGATGWLNSKYCKGK
jgi:uncharacterized protein YgiM (DUF1202 family)